MIDENTEEKQNYLRNEILDKGYDGQKFSEFFLKKAGTEGGDLDLTHFNMNEIIQTVKEFKEECSNQNNTVKDILETHEENTEKQDLAEGPSNPPQEDIPQEKEQEKNQDKGQENNYDQKPEKIPDNSSSNINQSQNPQENSNDESLIKCYLQKENELGSMNNLEVYVQNPKLVRQGIFSFSNWQFLLALPQFRQKVTRKMNDFYWFQDKLYKMYPEIIFPPLPKEAGFFNDTEQKMIKKVRLLNRFLESLTKNKLIRSGQLYRSFVMLSQNKFENAMKEFDESRPVEFFYQHLSLTGTINVGITKERESEANKIQQNLSQKDKYFSKLNAALKGLIKEFAVMSRKLEEVSSCLKELSCEYSVTLRGEYIENAFDKLSTLFKDWSKGYIDQQKFFKEEIKEYFKFINKEISSFNTLSLKYTTMKKKYEEINWYIKAKEDGREETLDEFKQVEKVYGFYLNRLCDEYNRVIDQHSESMKKQLTFFNDKKGMLFSDYNNLLHFLSMKI